MQNQNSMKYIYVHTCKS